MQFMLSCLEGGNCEIQSMLGVLGLHPMLCKLCYARLAMFMFGNSFHIPKAMLSHVVSWQKLFPGLGNGMMLSPSTTNYYLGGSWGRPGGSYMCLGGSWRRLGSF